MKILIQIFLILVLLSIGMVAGLMIGNLPYITLEREVGFGDIANFILALVLAIVIPVILNNWLDNTRNIKNFLIDEVRGCLDELSKIKEKIDKCCINGETVASDKRDIVMNISGLEMKVSSLISQLNGSFKRRSGDMREELYVHCREYWREVTGGELMSQRFKINKSFCKNHDKAFLEIEGYLKKCVHLINFF